MKTLKERLAEYHAKIVPELRRASDEKIEKVLEAMIAGGCTAVTCPVDERILNDYLTRHSLTEMYEAVGNVCKLRW